MPVLSEFGRLHTNGFKLLLGQTRLSILDLSNAGHQPMQTRDGRYTLIYNGEVYNYKELREELSVEGVEFISKTDTEVVLQALIHWGKKALLKFTGMFSLVLYDMLDNTLFCARDFFGIKPFFWHKGECGFCFASEIPALLSFPCVTRRVNPFAAYQFLCYGQYDTGPSTMIDQIYVLPPAHCITICFDDTENFIPEPYWQPDITKTISKDFDESAEYLRQLFLDSVHMHVRSDVPFGAALSGGIDSSAVTCAIRHLEPDIDLHTFSFIAPGSTISEEAWANKVSDHAKTVHHTITIQPNDICSDLDTLILAQGEPFGSTSIYAQYRVFQLAKECGITVTLDGQGADELLAGYHGYPGPRFASLIHSGNFYTSLKFLHYMSKWPGRTRSYLCQQCLRELIPDWLIPLALRCVGRSATPAWLDIDALTQENVPMLRLDLRCERFPSRYKLKQKLAYQLTWDGLPQLLRHGDRNSMAHSVESRVPFLTKDIAEFCLSLPEEYLIDMQGTSKSIFRKAMRGIVPDSVLNRNDKIGFATPEEDWLIALTVWLEETVRNAEAVPYIRLDAIQKEWQAIRYRKKAFGFHVWRCVCYIRWAQLIQAHY
jgi:asparagine synthase (glutamine-hydrolysing)